MVLVLVFCVEEKWFGTSAIGEAENDWYWLFSTKSGLWNETSCGWSTESDCC